MVTTRRQQKQNEDASANKSREESGGLKRSHDNKIMKEQPITSSKKPRLEVQEDNKRTTRPQDTARCEANQPLVDALHRLSGAMFKAQRTDDKNRYKALAISRAAQAVAQLDFQVTSGQRLGQPGPDKVAGIGKGTANYIDEFLESGELIEIEEYEQMAHEAEGHDGSNDTKDDTKERHKVEKDADETAEVLSKDNPNHVIINRAPVLTLWVTVVAERQGFSHSEALSYAKFVSVVFAQSKGKALGLFHSKKHSDGAKEKKVDAVTAKGERVQGFGRMNIPVERKDGDRLAVLKGSTINPADVEGYLKRSFGDKLDVTRNAMKELATSVSVEDLEAQAYKLYEKFRPPWKGWGKKSVLDLSRMHEMAQQT